MWTTVALWEVQDTAAQTVPLECRTQSSILFLKNK